MIATYDSRCPCGNYIEAGDEIGLVDGQWVCEHCVEENGGEDREAAS